MMNVVDIVIILLFFVVLVRGAGVGLVRQAFSAGGLIVGLLIGAFLQGKLVSLVHEPGTKALLSLFVVLGMGVIFLTIGEYFGAVLKLRLENTRFRSIGSADRALGSVVAGVTLLLAVWLGASIFSNVPASWLQRQIRNSFIVAQLDRSLPSAPNVASKLGRLINPNNFPQVFNGSEPSINTDTPLPAVGDLTPAVQKTMASVVKIEGTGCGGIVEGSGFVASQNTVVTNAHVVAGVLRPRVIDTNGTHATKVVWFDPDLDFAVLKTADLAAPPLKISSDIVDNGRAGAVLGYPGGGDFSANPATVLDSFTAVGRDIYNQNSTQRSIYSIKAEVVPGNSGGPLIDARGTVIGLIFAQSATYDQVGYALTTPQIISELGQAKNLLTPVSTGTCAE